MISANVNSAFCVDLLVSDGYWIQCDQLGTRDDYCLSGK
jgi:hypothetical protein